MVEREPDNEENVEVPAELPPFILPEDLEVGPEPDGKPITRESVIDSEETA